MSREEFLNLAFPMFSNEFLLDSIGTSNAPLFDVQKKIKLFHQRIDFLTGLPNYTKCLEDMSENKERSVVLFHINNMFDINDAF
jgi:hypothetical protein